MAKLNVAKLTDGRIEYNGGIYEKAEYPIKRGDIVQANESYSDDIEYGGFYEVVAVDNYDDFRIIDDEGDKRERDINDDEFVPYRKVAEQSQQPLTITLTQPVHLIITNIASIEFKTE